MVKAYIKINSALANINKPEIKEKIKIFFFVWLLIKINKNNKNERERNICIVIEELCPTAYIFKGNKEKIIVFIKLVFSKKNCLFNL